MLVWVEGRMARDYGFGYKLFFFVGYCLCMGGFVGVVFLIMCIFLYIYMLFMYKKLKLEKLIG